jgi:hypothetical protein
MRYIILILVFTSCHGTQKKGLSESPGYRVDSFYVDTLDRKPTGGLSFYSYSSSKTDSLTHLVDSLKKELRKCKETNNTNIGRARDVIIGGK